MLKNAYLVVKVGFDTDENEPSKVGGSSSEWGESLHIRVRIVKMSRQVAMLKPSERFNVGHESRRS